MAKIIKVQIIAFIAVFAHVFGVIIVTAFRRHWVAETTAEIKLERAFETVIPFLLQAILNFRNILSGKLVLHLFYHDRQIVLVFETKNKNMIVFSVYCNEVGGGVAAVLG